jgi:[ribosomal protein S18]-alanine N-acetyltransferase
MTPEDLATLHARCFTAPRPWSATEFRDMLASPATFLCTNSGGFLLGRTAGPEAEILTLAVAPESRRKGHALALLTDTESRMRAAKIQQIFLEVAENNTAAVALYHAAGYTSAGYRKDYYDSTNGRKVSALVLTMDLSTG